MVDFSQEAHLGRCHGVVFGEEEFQLEDAAFVGRLCGPVNLHVEVAEVIFVGDGVNSRDPIMASRLASLESFHCV